MITTNFLSFTIQSGLAYRAAQRLQKADNAAVVLARRPTGRLCQSALAGGSLRRRVKPRCSSCDIRWTSRTAYANVGQDICDSSSVSVVDLAARKSIADFSVEMSTDRARANQRGMNAGGYHEESVDAAGAKLNIHSVCLSLVSNACDDFRRYRLPVHERKLPNAKILSRPLRE